MKLNVLRFFLILSTFFMSAWSYTNVVADIVDPISDDTWRNLTVNIKQNDQRGFPDYFEDQYIKVYWNGLLIKNIKVNDITPNKPLTKVFTQPWRDKTDYKIVLTYDKNNSFTLFTGKINNKNKAINILLKRIDVAPMVVTREDGSNYSVEEKLTKVSIFRIREDRDKYDLMKYYQNTGGGLIVSDNYLYEVKVEGKTEDGWDYYKTILDYRN